MKSKRGGGRAVEARRPSLRSIFLGEDAFKEGFFRLL
jgi:hypothetical protein